MGTNLNGRLKNTSLPLSHCLMPLFEAVVNSIHATEESELKPEKSFIQIEIIRNPQFTLKQENANHLAEITGFIITDNGIGFNDSNMSSFETLDSELKASKGCRGVGRLLWLKAFGNVLIKSYYLKNSIINHRAFSFDSINGVKSCIDHNTDSPQNVSGTSVRLENFVEKYRKAAPKSAESIANSLLEHCLWYFIRAGGCPKITIKDNNSTISLDNIFDQYVGLSTEKSRMELKGHSFEITHLKIRALSYKHHTLAFCAANRLVKEDNISGKINGLYGRISDQDGDFFYSCYVSSKYLDDNVRPERTSFDISNVGDDLFSEIELNFEEIKRGLLEIISEHLSTYLTENIEISKKRVEDYVSNKAPRYRPVLKRIYEKNTGIDPTLSDKDLDIVLHKHLSELESDLITKGHQVMQPKDHEDNHQYNDRLKEYMKMADDIKKSDLANYVFHRKTILDILDKATKKDASGRYIREDIIHELIMPMKKTSDDISIEGCNLWLIDERLAFHDFLASDKTLRSMPITGSTSTKEPDICALNVLDNPILVSEGQSLPLASITVIEIKRPMRNDAAQGEDKDPIDQALGYLDRIRDGNATTRSGRAIPNSKSIAGYCYIIADLTPTIIKRCKQANLQVTSDAMGYFGYNANFNAYIEVISFDRLLNSARQRNRAFFDQLGLPNN